MLRTDSCRLTDRSCILSIAALRSAVLHCRARRTEIVLQSKLPNLGASSFKSMVGASSALVSPPNNPGRAFKKLVLPSLDLVRIHVELLRQLDQRVFALHRQRHFHPEGRRVVPPRSSRHRPDGELLAGCVSVSPRAERLILQRRLSLIARRARAAPGSPRSGRMRKRARSRSRQ